MAVKFNRAAPAASRTLITLPDHDALTIPAGDCLIGVIVTFDGNLATGTASQHLVVKGEYGTTANFQLLLNGTTGSNPGKFQNYINGNQSNACMAPVAVEAGKSYFVGNIKLGSFFYSVICPVLTQEPADGAAVFISASNTSGSRYVLEELNSATALLIGGRSATDRQFDHSISRFFIAEGTFTLHDVAKLAFGREITELAVPRVYLRMNGPDDIKDIGPNELPLTTSGVFLQGSDPGFGYVSQPVAPTITGQPTINGSAKVNSTVTATPAPMSGTPLPTAKWQWSIAGVDVAGATAATYAIQPGDDTKALRARQIADNGVGSPATSTSDPVLVTSGDVNITWAGLAAERICQRVAGAGCFIGLEGNWSGPTAPARMEMRLFAAHTGALSKDWFNAGGEFIAGGTWRARPWVPTPTHGKKYRAQLRALDANGNVLFTMAEPHANRFGVGDIIAFIGSSSPTAWTGPGTGGGYQANDDAVSTITGESTAPAWGLLGTYGAYIAMANYWAERENVPVAVFSAASSGTSLTDWAKADGGLFAAFKRFIAFAGGLLAAVVSSSGSNDAAAAGIVTGVDQHYDKIVAMVENTRSYTGQPELPFLWAGYNRRTDGRNPQSDYVRAAENRIGDYPFVYHVQSLDYPLVDNAHMPSSDAKRYCLDRLMILLAEARMGNYMRGSEIHRMQSNSDGSVDVKFKHRGATSLVANSTITGFRAYGVVDGAEVELTGVAAAITAGDAVRVTASGTITRLTYLEGNAPDIGTPLYSNTTPPLPVTAEAFMALTAAGEEVPDTTAPVMSGAISITNITTSGATLSFQAATDDVGVVGYEYSINGGTSYVNSGLSRSFAVSALTASTTYQVRVRAYDAAGNRSAPLSASFTTLANEPPVEVVIDASKIPASRKVVFPGGTRVIPFGTKPNSIVPDAPYYRNGKWWIDKVPEDERYYVADFRIDIAEAGSPAVKAEAIPGGVKVLEQAVVQGSLIPVKLGGFDELRGALNFCTFRVTLANGEQIDRTVWFSKVDLQWVLEKDPEDKRYYVADVSRDLIDSNTTVSAVTAAAVGVTELVKPQMQGRLAVVKLGGMDTSADPLNYCKLRFDCANGERFYRTIHFKRVDN